MDSTAARRREAQETGLSAYPVVARPSDEPSRSTSYRVVSLLWLPSPGRTFSTLLQWAREKVTEVGPAVLPVPLSYTISRTGDVVLGLIHRVTGTGAQPVEEDNEDPLVEYVSSASKDIIPAPRPIPPPKSVLASQTTITHLVRPPFTDARGLVFSGQLLAWIDICAGITAKRHCVYDAVTASMDAIHFIAPLRLGNVCTLVGQCHRAWRTSVEVGVRVQSEDMMTGERRDICFAYLTFVAIKEGKPMPVPSLAPSTPAEVKRYEEADVRRSRRFATATPRAELRPISFEYKEVPEKGRGGGRFCADQVLVETGSLVSSTSTSLKTCGQTVTQVVEIVFPEHANSYGTTFGGQIMKWMEYCAVIAANRHVRSELVVASMDSVNFLRSSRVGDLVVIKAIVSAAFEHSVEVYVTVEAMTPGGGGEGEDKERTTMVMTNDGWLTVVAVEAEDESHCECCRRSDAIKGKGRRFHAPSRISGSNSSGGGGTRARESNQGSKVYFTPKRVTPCEAETLAQRQRLEGAQGRRQARLAQRSDMMLQLGMSH